MCPTVTKSASQASLDKSNVTEETDTGLGQGDLMERERLEELQKILWKLITSKVIPLCSKSLRLEAGSMMEFQEDALELIINNMIRLGESEPCGINGGMLVINFGGEERHLTMEAMPGDASGVSSDQGPVRLAQLPICTDYVATYELHLTIIPCTKIMHRVANLFRWIQAKPSVLVIDQKFKLLKKKLYRS